MPTQFTTDLPAPTNLTYSPNTETSVDYSWTANHTNGDTRVEYQPYNSTNWTTDATVPYSTETETVTAANDEDIFTGRVVAETDYEETATTEQIKLSITIDDTFVYDVTIDGDSITENTTVDGSTLQ